MEIHTLSEVAMQCAECRDEARVSVHQIDAITVYRDRRCLSVEQARARLAEKRDLYNVFSIVAAVQNASATGIGIRFCGQHLRARNLLRWGELVILKFCVFPRFDLPLVGEAARDGRVALLVKAICRWFRTGPLQCAAGFELSGANDPDALAFLHRQFAVSSDPLVELPVY